MKNVVVIGWVIFFGNTYSFSQTKKIDSLKAKRQEWFIKPSSVERDTQLANINFSLARNFRKSNPLEAIN